MLIKAKHNIFLYTFFRIYTNRLIKKHFNRVEINGNFIDNRLPILVICNHISWWDGFWVMYLNMKILHRRFYFMMLEEQLHKYSYFKYVGAFSVKRQSKSVLETLKYTTDLLENPENMVLIFPQGRIQSMHKQEFKFEKGIEYILQRTKGKIQILFVANFVDFFSNKKPNVNMYIKEFRFENFQSDNLNECYNQFYNSCVGIQILLDK